MKIKKKLSVSLILVFFLTNSFFHGALAVSLSPSPTYEQIEKNADSNITASNKYIWYSPRFSSEHGGSSDFFNIFSSPNQWSHARERTSVFFINTKRLRDLNIEKPGFIKDTLVPFLKKNEMNLALDVTGATWSSCKAVMPSCNQTPKRCRESWPKVEIKLIEEIEAAGGKVSFAAMQSAFSIAIPQDIFPGCDLTLNQRASDMSWYVNFMKDALPNGASIPGGTRNIQYGLTDALLAQGENHSRNVFDGLSVNQAFSRLVNYQENNGGFLDFFLFDHPVEYLKEVDSKIPDRTSTFESIKSVRNIFANKGVKTGIHLTSFSYLDPPRDEEFAKNILWYAQQLESKGIYFSYYVIASWYPVPLRELPESPSTATNFSMTRNLKVLSQYILGRNSRIDNVPPARPTGLRVQ